jgi:hypothetical protein
MFVLEDIQNTSQLALRRRLQSFVRAQLTEDGAPRPTDLREEWTFEEALAVARLPDYAWITFRDGERPRGLGIRYLGQHGTQGWYEIAAFYQPGDVQVSRWRFQGNDRWARCET